MWGGTIRILTNGCSPSIVHAVLGEEPVQPCLISLDGSDVGYIQYYPVAQHKDYELEEATDTCGVDMFIGEPEYWSRGIGSRALAAVVKHIFDNLGAQRVVIDPHIDNLRAVRAYEKAGFRKVKVLREHELHEGTRKDCWLMVIDRETREGRG